MLQLECFSRASHSVPCSTECLLVKMPGWLWEVDHAPHHWKKTRNTLKVPMPLHCRNIISWPYWSCASGCCLRVEEENSLSHVMCEQPRMHQEKKTKPFSERVTGQGMIKHSFQCLQMARTHLKHEGYEGGSFLSLFIWNLFQILHDRHQRTSVSFWALEMKLLYSKGIRILSTQNRVWKASGKEFWIHVFWLSKLA